MKPPQGRIGSFWRREIEQDNEFIDKCTRLWDMKLDTFDISLNVFQPEHVVARAVRLGRERRRRLEEQNAEEKEWQQRQP